MTSRLEYEDKIVIEVNSYWQPLLLTLLIGFQSKEKFAKTVAVALVVLH